MDKRRIDQEPWCQELIKRLRKHKANEARLEFLEGELERSVYPKNKLVATYGEPTGTGLGAVSPEELEFRDLLYEVRQIHAAKNGLEQLERVIIEKTYEENLSYWHIIDIYIPQNFKDKHRRPLFISRSTYDRCRRRALKKMGKTLGLLQNDTFLTTQEAK